MKIMTYQCLDKYMHQIIKQSDKNGQKTKRKNKEAKKQTKMRK